MIAATSGRLVQMKANKGSGLEVQGFAIMLVCIVYTIALIAVTAMVQTAFILVKYAFTSKFSFYNCNHYFFSFNKYLSIHCIYLWNWMHDWMLSLELNSKRHIPVVYNAGFIYFDVMQPLWGTWCNTLWLRQCRTMEALIHSLKMWIPRISCTIVSLVKI